MIPKNLSLQDLTIITTISESEKTTVSLVSVKETEELAVLKKYADRQGIGSYEQVNQLKSPFFPKVYDVWEEGGEAFLLEEYVSGETLQEKLEKKSLLSESEVTDIARQICMALQMLHHATPPIIHRDIKPENVMVMSDGKVKLIDFDAAREYKEEQERDTVMMGTKEYASPEQFGFMQTDIRSDIYSWGIVFAELLGQASVSRRYAIKAKKIIDKATMFDPEKRYANTTVLLQNLDRLNKQKKLLLPIGIATIMLCTAVVVFNIVMDTLQRTVQQTQQTEETSNESEIQTEMDIESESEFQTEAGSTQEPIGEIEEQLSLKEVYKYVSIGNEVREKVVFLQNTKPELYSGTVFEDNDSGIYAKNQECEIGNLYLTMRFLKAHPRDIVFSDNELEGANIEWVYYRPYLEEEKMDGEKVVLLSEAYKQEFGNVFVFSKEYLQTMEPGMYTVYIDTDDKNYAFYLIVHGKDEEVDNFRVHIMNDIAYYSQESQNDVVFYVNNTPFPIKEIQMNEVVLDSSEYQLVDGGFGVVFQKSFFDKYGEMESMPFIITMENGKQVMCRIINLSHFE